MKREIITLFPSLLFKGQLSDMSIIDDAEQKIRNLKITNQGSLNEPNHFISSDMLQDNADFKDISKLIIDETEGILDFYHVVRDSHYISNMWSNITSTNHKHMLHIHPNCFLSGLIYLKTPDKCGPTVFSDPRPGARMFEPTYSKMTEVNSGVVIETPKKGKMLIWNSWLPHGVERGYNEHNEDRIIISFNIMLKATITTPTSRLVL